MLPVQVRQATIAQNICELTSSARKSVSSALIHITAVPRLARTARANHSADCASTAASSSDRKRRRHHQRVPSSAAQYASQGASQGSGSTTSTQAVRRPIITTPATRLMRL